MQRFFPVLVLLLTSGCIRAPEAARRPEPGATIAFTHVNVVPMTRDTVMHDQTVLIRSGRIIQVGPAGEIRVPRGARAIDAAGNYLIPGLWDMHVHTLSDAGAFFPLFLTHGVTGVRDMGGFLDSLQTVRARSAGGTVLAPRLVAAGPILDGFKHRWSHPIAWHLETPEQARAAVDSLTRVGVDFLKVYSTLSPEVYRALVTAARDRKVTFAGHVPLAMSAADAADAGQASLEHGGVDITTTDCVTDGRTRFSNLLRVWARQGYGAFLEGKQSLRQERNPACAGALYARYQRNGTWVVPTIVNELKDSVTVNWSAFQYVSEAARETCRKTVAAFEQAPGPLRREYYRGFLDDIGALHHAGVPLLAGTDVPNPCVVPGASLHTELERLVQAGLTPYEALRTATLNPARFLGATDSLGTIAEGKVADLVLLDANPLADIRNTKRIQAVVRGGKLLDRVTLDALLARSRTAANP
jgi:hypothetical protein